MGNQGNSSPEARVVEEWIQAGEIGTVKEVHAWTNRPIWPQGLERPREAMEAPYTMDWDEEARELVAKAPEGMEEFIIENSETYAREKGYEKVTRQSIAEQMEAMGMNLDEMLADL